MATRQQIADFLSNIETKAYKRTIYTVKNEDAALDIIQDSMLKLVEKYSDKPAEDLLFLFQKILSNTMMDWFRKQKSQANIILSSEDYNLDNDDDFLEAVEHSNTIDLSESSFDIASRGETLAIIEHAIEQLPSRQREAFLLRYWEEMSVSETAQIMDCSEGSVKTHCSRATQSLAKILSSQGIHLKDYTK